MPDPTSRAWRLRRSAVFAAVATLLAAMGHTVGGGSMPDPALLLVLLPGLTAVGMSLGQKQRGYFQLLGVLVVCQVGFHLLFDLSGHSMGASSAHAGGGSLTHGFDWTRMIAFHLIAAATTPLVMSAADRALFRLFSRLRRALRRSISAPVVARAPWTVLIRIAVPAALAHAVAIDPRRGPPAAGPFVSYSFSAAALTSALS